MTTLKTKQENLQAYTAETMPDWAKGFEGIEQLLDGVTLQHSINLRPEYKDSVPVLDGMDVDKFKDCSPEKIALEIVCACVTAWLAAMSSQMHPTDFNRIASPLPDVIGGCLAKMGLITPVPEEKLKEIEEAVSKKFKTKTGFDDPVAFYEKRKADLLRDEPDPDEEDALSRAIEKLKSVGRGMIH